MADIIYMPKEGITVETCIIFEWFKQVGDTVEIGDALFSYETDKAVFECVSTVSGELLEIFCDSGYEVPVLTPVCVVGARGEDVSALRPGGGLRSDGDSRPDGDLHLVGGAAVSGAQPPAAAFYPPGMPGTSSAPGMPGTSGTLGAPGTPGTSGTSGTPGTTITSVTSGAPITPSMPDLTESTGRISPRARKLAERSGADPARASGTGPNGRVIERDVREIMSGRTADNGAVTAYPGAVTSDPGAAATYPGAAATYPGAITPAPGAVTPASAPPPAGRAGADRSGADRSGADRSGMDPAGFEDIKFTGIRKTIAKTMFESLQTMAQLTHTHSFDATDIQHYRERLKALGGELSGITIGDIILCAVTRTLKNHPDLNAHLLQGNILRRFSSVNLGVAVDTPRGLMVPTVFDADKKTLTQISGEVKSLAEKCREGSISPDALSFGSFTVSNLGNLGVESFTPVINPPQTGILGVCGITLRPREKDGSIELYPAMSLSLTYDHRAVDGAPASRFLKELCENLERFTALLEE